MRSGATDLFWQRFAFGLGRQPDQEQSQNIHQGNDRAGFGVTAVEKGHELSHAQGADGGEDAPEIETESLTRGADARWKKFRQVQGQPSVKGGGACADKTG